MTQVGVNYDAQFTGIKFDRHARWVERHQSGKYLNEFLVKQTAAPGQDELRRFVGHILGSVSLNGDQLVIGVGNGDNPSEGADLWALEASGIAAAVPALVVLLHRLHHVLAQVGILGQNLPAALGMTGDILPYFFLRISGHTDKFGSADLNLRLSKERAQTIRDYVVVFGGVPASRVQFDGYGSDKPIVTEVTDEDRKLNRRVEFEIYRAAIEIEPELEDEF